jgi:hypothetical protein
MGLYPHHTKQSDMTPCERVWYWRAAIGVTIELKRAVVDRDDQVIRWVLEPSTLVSVALGPLLHFQTQYGPLFLTVREFDVQQSSAS